MVDTKVDQVNDTELTFNYRENSELALNRY